MMPLSITVQVGIENVKEHTLNHYKKFTVLGSQRAQQQPCQTLDEEFPLLLKHSASAVQEGQPLAGTSGFRAHLGRWRKEGTDTPSGSPNIRLAVEVATRNRHV